MKDCNLCRLCYIEDWPEVRKYLSSDAAEEEKKSNIIYRNQCGRTCLHEACCRGAPDDIIEAMLSIGGKESIMKKANDNATVLHRACFNGASYNIIKMLIEVGGKNLVMAKDEDGDTALHFLCWNINRHTKAAEKIKLILQVVDANLLLSAKCSWGNTPLEIATDNGASNIIKKLLTLQSTTTSARSNNSPSANIVPADNATPIPQSNQEQDTTRSSSTNNDPNITIRGLGIEQNHQSQLREAEEKAKTIQQDFDQKCI
jgi:ankyrin repeat protein